LIGREFHCQVGAPGCQLTAAIGSDQGVGAVKGRLRKAADGLRTYPGWVAASVAR
jgi:hypothetical protein